MGNICGSLCDNERERQQHQAREIFQSNNRNAIRVGRSAGVGKEPCDSAEVSVEGKRQKEREEIRIMRTGSLAKIHSDNIKESE